MNTRYKNKNKNAKVVFNSKFYFTGIMYHVVSANSSITSVVLVSP